MAKNLDWPAIRSAVRAGQVIPNWTRLKGNWGDPFRIVEVRTDRIDVDTPGADLIQKVHRRDFEAVLAVWRGYLAGTVPRKDMTPITRCSKYVISILHWIETR